MSGPRRGSQTNDPVGCNLRQVFITFRILFQVNPLVNLFAWSSSFTRSYLPICLPNCTIDVVQLEQTVFKVHLIVWFVKLCTLLPYPLSMCVYKFFKFNNWNLLRVSFLLLYYQTYQHWNTCLLLCYETVHTVCVFLTFKTIHTSSDFFIMTLFCWWWLAARYCLCKLAGRNSNKHIKHIILCI